MYKLASATRADRMPIDLMGPWYNNTPWPRIWWNLNIQLTYWPELTANRLELGEPFCKMIDDGKAALANDESGQTVGLLRASVAQPHYRWCGPSGDETMKPAAWKRCTIIILSRYGMDDAKLQRLFPLLKGSMNYYFHHLKADADGHLHTTEGYSPEYPGQPTPNPDYQY